MDIRDSVGITEILVPERLSGHFGSNEREQNR
jgi:hypothetical protein